MDRYGNVLVKPDNDKVVVLENGKALVSDVTGNTQTIIL